MSSRRAINTHEMKQTLLALLTVGSFFLQGQTFTYATAFGGSGEELINASVSDPMGNIYSVGTFNGTVDFDPGPTTFNLTSNGQEDIFIQKLTPAGNLIWAVSIGGSSDDLGTSITIDTTSHIYVTGHFRGTMDIDPGANTQNITSTGATDIFILKLDQAGNYVWGTSFGGISEDFGLNVVYDNHDGIITTGAFKSTVDFDPGSGTDNRSSQGFDDFFIHKVDLNGNYQWVKAIGGVGVDLATSIDADDDGSIYVTGAFQDSVDFDPGTGIDKRGSSVLDVFIEKLDSSGNFVWVETIGSPSIEIGQDIHIDNQGNIYLTGYYTTAIDLDPSAMGSDIYSFSGVQDIFLLKLDPSANYAWGMGIGGSGSDLSRQVTTDKLGNVYLTGSYSSTVDFDPSTASSFESSSGAGDGFVQKLTPNGDFVWVATIAGASEQAGTCITVLDNLDIVVGGNFESVADFDPSVMNTALDTSNGLTDCFLTKWSQCPIITSTEVITACGSYTWIDGVTYTASNDSATFALTTSSGCDSVVTLDLTINVVSDLSTTINGATITANNDSATYQWLDCDNNFAPISGATAKSFTATTNGNYAVELTENGCVDTSACVNINNVDLNELDFSETFQLYPNPTNGTFTIEFNSTQDHIEMVIVDAVGRELVRENHDRVSRIQSSLNYSAGMYLIILTNQDNEQSFVRVAKR